MNSFLVVLIILAVLVVLGLVAYIADNTECMRKDLRAWQRLWETKQIEHDTERRMRETTQTAMLQMLAEARRYDGNDHG